MGPYGYFETDSRPGQRLKTRLFLPAEYQPDSGFLDRRHPLAACTAPEINFRGLFHVMYLVAILPAPVVWLGLTAPRLGPSAGPAPTASAGRTSKTPTVSVPNVGHRGWAAM